jgi:cytochrome P450
MHREPGQWAALCANPDEIAPRAVEECLRYESSLQGTYRTALQPAKVGDFDVKPGERVLCLLGSANRDPAVFERPDVMDVTRKDSRMLSFGGGIHHCIGQQLARLEGRIAFATLAKRLPQLRITTPEPTWRPGFLFRGLTELRCAF